MKHLLLFLFAALCAVGQDMRQLPPACGPEDVSFEVKLDKTTALPKPDSGKALVYVIQDQFHFAGCLKCPDTTRVGLDGAWMGANNKLSWVSFQVAPGTHHLCTDLQASKLFRPIIPQRIALANFTAEAGATYYFRVRLEYGGGGPPAMDLAPTNADEGKLLVLSYYPSSSTAKK